MADLLRLLPFQPDPIWVLGGLITLAALLWNVTVSAQKERTRHSSRITSALGALCALLIVPALIVGIASTTLLMGRAVVGVGWLWPLTLTLFCIQAAFVVGRGNSSWLLSLPILASNVVLCLAAWARFLTTWLPDVSPTISGLQAAHVAFLSHSLGTPVLGSALALQVPLLAPLVWPRRRVPTILLTFALMLSSLTAAGVAASYPQGVRAAATFAQFDGSVLAERRADDFAVGLRILPALGQSADVGMVQRDLAVADSLRAGIVSVTLLPSGTTIAALELLSDALDAARRDSIRLAVTLGFESGERELFDTSPDVWSDNRLRALDRIVRTLRPEVLFAADDPLGAGARIVGIADVSVWQAFHQRAAEQTRRIRPRTRVGTAVSFTNAGDSAWYAWASSSRATDIVGLIFSPGPTGGASIAAQLRVASLRMSAVPVSRVHWVLHTEAYPFDFGEQNQEHALWGTIAWATRSPHVRAAIIAGAGDYDRLTGLRRSNGTLRDAVGKLSTIQPSLDDARLAGQ